jgi:hypothetical protein
MFRVFATAAATVAILGTVILTLDAPFNFAGPIRSTRESVSLVLLGGGLLTAGARFRRRSSR